MNKDHDFKMGDVVVFDPSKLNPGHWDNLPEGDRLKYYGHLGYGRPKGALPKTFVFLCDLNQSPGHCVLVDMDTNETQCMYHSGQFRLADPDTEF